MADNQYFQVITTTDSEEAAATLARSVVAARLGACVQVFPIRSFYRWEAEVHDDPEWRLEVKTSAARLNELRYHLTTQHTYDVPEVLVTPVVGGHAEYLSWVDDETAPA